MSKEHASTNLQMIPVNKIEVLNPRERNGRIFDDIVGNIKTIGLKKPITVTVTGACQALGSSRTAVDSRLKTSSTASISNSGALSVPASTLTIRTTI